MHSIQLNRSSLYTAATFVEGLDDDTVSGSEPTSGTIIGLFEEKNGGKASDEKVVFGLVAAQVSTGEVIFDGNLMHIFLISILHPD